ncbi:hypothetical protein Q9L58_007116 [Maublancomyces gigas]|uniref:Uncharacterized protein n=1 Tax=Discina gigas TaxID=1032678 RepID=A0ABR3GDC8_9PEZI
MGIEDGELTLSNEDMLDIFDPIINQILSLVQEQIDMVETQDQEKSRISAVLLAGGFGSSKYLLERLQNGLRKGEGPNKSPPEILHPTNAWNAVARGAAYGIHITSRRLEARKHYGIEFNDNFKFGEHPAGNLIGDKVSENTPIALSFTRSVPIDDNMIFTEYLYGCEKITAPEYSNHTDDDSKFSRIPL